MTLSFSSEGDTEILGTENQVHAKTRLKVLGNDLLSDQAFIAEVKSHLFQTIVSSIR